MNAAKLGRVLIQCTVFVFSLSLAASTAFAGNGVPKGLSTAFTDKIDKLQEITSGGTPPGHAMHGLCTAACNIALNIEKHDGTAGADAVSQVEAICGAGCEKTSCDDTGACSPTAALVDHSDVLFPGLTDSCIDMYTKVAIDNHGAGTTNTFTSGVALEAGGSHLLNFTARYTSTGLGSSGPVDLTGTHSEGDIPYGTIVFNIATGSPVVLDSTLGCSLTGKVFFPVDPVTHVTRFIHDDAFAEYFCDDGVGNTATLLGQLENVMEADYPVLYIDRMFIIAWELGMSFGYDLSTFIEADVPGFVSELTVYLDSFITGFFLQGVSAGEQTFAGMMQMVGSFPSLFRCYFDNYVYGFYLTDGGTNAAFVEKKWETFWNNDVNACSNLQGFWPNHGDSCNYINDDGTTQSGICVGVLRNGIVISTEFVVGKSCEPPDGQEVEQGCSCIVDNCVGQNVGAACDDAGNVCVHNDPSETNCENPLDCTCSPS